MSIEKNDRIVSLWNLVINLPVEMISLLYHLCQNLSGDQGEKWLENLKRFLKKEVVDWKERILRQITTVTIPAIGRFCGRDDLDQSQWYFSSNIEENFLDKIEEPTTETLLRQHELLKDSRDEAIRKEIGTDREEITFGQFTHFVREQGDRTEVYIIYITYITDKSGRLWAVGARWRGDRWSLNARLVADPCDWVAGRVILSR